MKIFTTISGNKGKSERTSDPGSKTCQQGLGPCSGDYSPQGLLIPGYATLMNKLRSDLSDVAISKIEGLIALYGALSEVQTYKGFLGVLTLYIKTHSTESVMSQVQNIVKSLFDEMTPQDSSGRPAWLDGMSKALVDWKLLVNSPAFSKVSRVLSLLVTLGVMDKKSVNLGNFELFAIEAQAKQTNAVDVIDALIETVVFFAEGAYQCFLNGSIKPLLFSSSEVLKLEEAYIEKMTEWEYVRNGNLEKFMNKTEKKFDKELEDLVEKLHLMYKTMPNGVEKKIIQQKWENLSKVRADYIAVRVNGGLRMAPYCLKIYGDTGVGKSTLADIAMMTTLKAKHMPCTTEYICTINEKDKHMSTYRSYITGIKLDDYGNSKMQFWDLCPTDWIIKICNNIREYAVMADLANKGKITIEPGCLSITTNVEDMHASLCSYNSMSVVRRAHMHIELKVRPEFETDGMLDEQKVLEKFGSLKQVNDCWLIDIKKPVASSHCKKTFGHFVVTHRDISIFEFMTYLVEKVRKHHGSQSKIVDAFSEPANIVQYCEDCEACAHDCTCGRCDANGGEVSDLTSCHADEDFMCQECQESIEVCSCEIEPQFGERIAQVITEKSKAASLDFSLKKLAFETKLEDLAVDKMYKACDLFMKSPYAYWTSWVPDCIMEHPYMRPFVLWHGSEYIEEDIRSSYRSILSFFVFGLISSFFLGIVPFMFFVVMGGFYTMSLLSNLHVARQNAYIAEISRRRGSLHQAFISAREKHVHYACGIFAGLAVLYGVVQVVKALKESISIQGVLQPRSIEDIKARDNEANPWTKSVWTLPKSDKNYSVADRGINALSKSLATIEVAGKFSNALWLRTHVIMMPLHLLPSESCEAKVNFRGNTIRFILNPSMVEKLPDKDAVLIYVPNTPPLKDILGYFMDEPCKMPLSCAMVGLTAKDESFTTSLFWQYVPALSNGFEVFAGSHYQVSGMNTFNGMCMAPIVTDNTKSAIVGVHIGGVADTPRGCGMSLTKPELERAIGLLHTRSTTFVPGPQSQDVEDVVCNKKIAISAQPHYKCPTNFLDGKRDIVVYGQITGRSTYHSEVIKTPISDLVEEVCGVPNQWGAPKFKNPETRADGKIDSGAWKPWFASLDVCSKPSIGFDPTEVDVAIADYLAELDEVFESQSALWKKDVRPLNDVEVVSGIDGKRFVDALASGTSMGYPINGPKKDHLIDLEPTEEHMCPRTFTPEVWAEVERLYKLADEGKSLNQIFGSSLKDEPTKLDKDKVRVFQAAPIALQILIRKYFLPIGRFLSCNPLVAECAVGINAHGPEWHELSQFMSKFGDDRVIAGDYSKYDLRMPAQLTISAFAVMIKLAIKSGNYTKQDVKRMFVIAHEVCTPLVAYNGTLMRFLGTNPSGQNMTVYVNSIVNSLLHRLAFRSVYPSDDLVRIGKDLDLGRPARFRDLVSLATYGDDAKGSVRVGYDRFNHVTMADYLDKNDMKFTMPDKESDPVPFMSRFDADFLKRTDRFDDRLGVYVGMLNESSIFKSLHSIVKSKVVSPKDVSAMNVEGALREWFFHGEEIFEKRRAQMKMIAARGDLHVRGLDDDYDTRVEAWKEQYTPQAGTRTIESELQTKVIELLGKPAVFEKPILLPNIGRPDMVYVHPHFAMVVETKAINGRPGAYRKVRAQAMKYATALHVLDPRSTVVGAIYTEDGFEVIATFGYFTCPRKFVAILNDADYKFSPV